MEIKIGEEYKSKELHNYFGGQRQGGISTPRNHPNIFIFANKRGKDYGYVDKWDEDDVYFRYTGEGQNGDMKFQSGNKAIRDHSADGKQVFLFEETKKSFARFVAEIICVDYMYMQTPDSTGKNRRGIQFIFEEINADSKNNNQETNRPHTHNKNPNTTERKGLVTSRVGKDIIDKNY